VIPRRLPAAGVISRKTTFQVNQSFCLIPPEILRASISPRAGARWQRALAAPNARLAHVAQGPHFGVGEGETGRKLGVAYRYVVKHYALMLKVQIFENLRDNPGRAPPV